MSLTALINVNNTVGESQSLISLLIADLQAAVANWSAVLQGSAVLNIELSIVTSNPGGDRSDWGFSVPIGQSNGLTVVESPVAYALTGGIPKLGTEILITIDDTYLRDKVWLDPNPTGGAAAVPADKIDAVSFLEWDLGVGIAFNSFRDFTTGTIFGTLETTFDQHVIFKNGIPYFHGSLANTVYGGDVPLTVGDLIAFGNRAPLPGTDLLSDLMNGVSLSPGQRYIPGLLDAAAMTDLGIPSKLDFINNSITQLYVGYFNRAPDPGGESYWATALHSGLSLAQIAQSFSVQAESTSLYAFLASPNTADPNAIKSFVDAIYGNLFNRTPDVGGESFWIGALQSQAISIGAAILAIINGAQGNDVTTVENKVTVGNYYAIEVFDRNVQWTQASAKDAFAGVTFDSSTIVNGRSKVETFVQSTHFHAAVATSVDVLGISTDIGFTNH
jgi:hypothetical protein